MISAIRCVNLEGLGGSIEIYHIYPQRVTMYGYFYFYGFIDFWDTVCAQSNYLFNNKANSIDICKNLKLF